ncbi:acetylornithine transaminase [Symbiobacterium thermophilum]|uniref:Acetylornithine aminotransferase n=1 Tax=Symbiobacterium thermophilum TaxID=2734 RepID=A0A953IAW9_SYMTR|nr:acetylornithine transaminase [Symbiobacterium thermophilum]MBY6275994.1 acetylornithine transaminase [Symbiobacterium thermophilum]
MADVSGSRSAALMARADAHTMKTYGRYPIALVRGEGVRCWDADGKEYLDFLGGIAVNVLGHAHPALVSAIADQAARLIHCSNLYYSEPMAELAELLTQHGGLDRVFFCNSGAEANEGAIKLARKYQWRKGLKAKNRIVSLTHSFHGRTLATVTATAKPAIQEGFGPLPEGFDYVEAGDVAALRAAVTDRTAAVIVEPVQGEGGVRPLAREFLEAARAICDERGALLIFDEIQCGMGRVGHLFAYQAFGVKPDILTLAKGLGGGVPIGAVCATEEAARGFAPGDHGTTFGGSPLACTAALATVKTLLSEDLPARAAAMGEYLLAGLRRLQAKHPGLVKEVRGMGLMLGIELTRPARPVLEKCHELGLLVNVTADTVVRLLPPYIITAADCDRALEILDQALAAVGSAG